ncbi:1-deoxy-D-xylulose-5-phosphate reductoisomerase, partial [Candidatus Roizmanbacteria bacterium]|nr:1-deoxy-D-xylulose-5-phosphate reductoisomerase [Candidatus Roizmanbacteria bacterium]
IDEFSPRKVAVRNQDIRRTRLSLKPKTTFYSGENGILELIKSTECDLVVVAISGAEGLRPTITAIREGRNIALATKEVMVLAGEIVRDEIAKKNREIGKRSGKVVELFPIDSEHSAIWQSLRAGLEGEVEKIILTCSGGPFRGKKRAELKKVTVEGALNHPNWQMGKKITIDSATLMNKGLEIIEARWLFDILEDKIEVVIHPQSILHSAVLFQDGSIIGQFGLPDMRVPIQYALTYPERAKNNLPRLSFNKLRELTFEEPDTKTFPSLTLSRAALKMGGTAPCVLNAADEVAVELFLQNKIKFLDIFMIIEKTMLEHKTVRNPSLADILEADTWARQYTISRFGGG